MAYRKDYDERANARCDLKAKIAAVRLLEQHGLPTTINWGAIPDLHVEVWWSKEPEIVEAACEERWIICPQFPFVTVNIQERRVERWKDGTPPAHYIGFRRDMKRAIFINDRRLRSYLKACTRNGNLPKMAPNKANKGSPYEERFMIPRNEVMLLDVKNNLLLRDPIMMAKTYIDGEELKAVKKPGQRPRLDIVMQNDYPEWPITSLEDLLWMEHLIGTPLELR